MPRWEKKRNKQVAMYASYNKNNAKGTLVGNWVKEEALRAGTGFSRRKVPVPYFAPDMKDSRREFTHDCVLVHTKSSSESSSSGPETTFETTNQASTRYGEFAVKLEPPGPRSSRRDIELLEQAKSIHEQQDLQRQQEERSQIPAGTVTKSSYQPLDPALLVNSSRGSRGRSGARVVDPAIQRSLDRTASQHHRPGNGRVAAEKPRGAILARGCHQHRAAIDERPTHKQVLRYFLSLLHELLHLLRVKELEVERRNVVVKQVSLVRRIHGTEARARGRRTDCRTSNVCGSLWSSGWPSR